MGERIILQVNQLSFAYGASELFSDVHFVVHEKEKVGLVGSNGSGKSTLIRLLTGEIKSVSGEINIVKNIRLNYIDQFRSLHSGTTVFQAAMAEASEIIDMQERLHALESKMSLTKNEQELQSILDEYALLTQAYEEAGGYGIEGRVRGVLRGLGFAESDMEQAAELLSGGGKTKLALARMLIRPAQLLLLDEPTNHLDLDSVEWLEQFLQSYAGAVMIVSHDRYFLDKVTQRTLLMDRGKVTSYSGNYSRFIVLQEQERKSQEKAYNKEHAERQRIEEYIRRNKAGQNAKQARGRETLLQRRQELHKPSEGLKLSGLHFTPSMSSAEQVLVTHDLTMSYPGKNLFVNLDLVIRRGERVAILGKNGTGKTSLFKIIMGDISAYAGDYRWGLKVKPAYYAQEQESLNEELTVLETIRQMRAMTEEQARTLLGRFLFRGDDVFKTVGVLSGGEKSRLVLAQLFLSGANVLLLDEPTNHLDIQAKEALEEALADFEGTILVISHDRYFLNRLCDRVLELENFCFHEYLGNYSDYRDKKNQLQAIQAEAEAEAEKAKSEQAQKTKQSELKEKASPPKLNPFKKKAALHAVEEEIQQLEIIIKKLSDELANEQNYQDGDKIKRIGEDFEQAQMDLETAYKNWEQLMES